MKHPDDPFSVSYERAVELVEEKLIKDKEKTLLTFEYQGVAGVVMKGRR